MRDYRLRWGRETTLWIGVGVAYGVLLVIAAFVVPIFSDAWGFTTTNAHTLVSQHGIYGVFVMSIPLLFALAIAIALLRSDRRGARALSWSLWGVLALGNLAAMFTIGVFVIPLTIALFLACRLFVAPKKRPASADA